MFKLKGIQLLDALNESAKKIKTGTTISLLIMEEKSKTIKTFNLGDSPIYLIRNNNIALIFNYINAIIK